MVEYLERRCFTMQTVAFTMQQVSRFAVLQHLHQGGINNVQAAEALQISVPQVQRLRRRIEQLGPPGVLHGNAGRAPANKAEHACREHLVQLVQQHYADYNFSHLEDTLAREHGLVISRETLRRWLRPLGIGRPMRRLKKHRRRRPRSPREGQLLFLDGSPHRWFGPEQPECCLLLASDDATGKPLVGLFQPSEDRDGCFRVCLRLFKSYGLPAAFYLDRASHFLTTRHGLPEGETLPPTQFQRALSELAVALKFAHSPQARGRGERLNGSFQGRLVAEFVHERIADLEQASDFLNRSFIPRYQLRFACAPQDARPAWRAVPARIDLRAVLCRQETRVVAHDNTVALDGARWQLLPIKRCQSYVRARVTVQCWTDGSLHVVHPRWGELPVVPAPP